MLTLHVLEIICKQPMTNFAVRSNEYDPSLPISSIPQYVALNVIDSIFILYLLLKGENEGTERG